MRIADHAAGTGVAGAGKTQILAGRLAGDGAACVQDARHHGGIEFRYIAFEQHRAVHHRHAGDADVVLDRDLLAAQKAFGAGFDIRLPVPGAVRIFRLRRPVTGRARRDRRQRRRDQLLEPGIGGQRDPEGLLQSPNLLTGENETETGSEVFDLLQGRKTNTHAAPTSCLLERKRKKPPAARKGPEWHQCRCYQWSRRPALQNEVFKGLTQTSSAVRKLFRHACIHVRMRLCLSVASLVNASWAAFLSWGSPNDAQRRWMID